ncbi:hypothetical protein [Planctomicrobium sp. SH664]|uniref:hypothetical protein n=1 Tax=Planctomicrobium sp. SH664 TaxID=3448125 RepID=UPI003F5C4E4A
MYTLRIPGHLQGLTSQEPLTGTKEEIAKKLLFPDPRVDVHGVRKLPRDADVILEQEELITVGKVHRREVHQIGRWTVSQLLPPGLLGGIF